MSEETVARLSDRIEYLIDRVNRLEDTQEKMAAMIQRMQLERARERGYVAGIVALASVIGAALAKFL
jgi:uncharacterized protein (UPF0335 family)